MFNDFFLKFKASALSEHHWASVEVLDFFLGGVKSGNKEVYVFTEEKKVRV